MTMAARGPSFPGRQTWTLSLQPALTPTLRPHRLVTPTQVAIHAFPAKQGFAQQKAIIHRIFGQLLILPIKSSVSAPPKSLMLLLITDPR
jgi:hypothetical protein